MSKKTGKGCLGGVGLVNLSFIQVIYPTAAVALPHHQQRLSPLPGFQCAGRLRFPGSCAGDSPRSTWGDRTPEWGEVQINHGWFGAILWYLIRRYIASHASAMPLLCPAAMTSAGGPISTIQPSSKSSSRSKCCSRDFSGCVTTMRVLGLSGPDSWIRKWDLLNMLHDQKEDANSNHEV